MNSYTFISFDKDGLHDHNMRNLIDLGSVLVPFFCLLVECSMNKIIYPKRLGIFHMGIVFLYLIMTRMIQTIQTGKPVYINNLNWNCEFNYLIFKIEEDEHNTTKPWNGNCDTYEDYRVNTLLYEDKPMVDGTCKSMFSNYYCPGCKEDQFINGTNIGSCPLLNETTSSYADSGYAAIPWTLWN